MSDFDYTEWITTQEAAQLTGYTQAGDLGYNKKRPTVLATLGARPTR
jgi:hypothetical protein